ncbi:MAG: outer membrane beta-barrel family protein, partial [Prevotellaceae bacterium]|nr:outer membrane beta-barrel family protein [Prevotellaceae bacterium]
FDIEKFNKTIDLDTVVLFTATTELEGAVVKSTKAKIKEDRRIMYPTQQQIKTTADGITLLSVMKLPKLTIIPATTDVKYWGSGTLLFYINDRPATIKQVRALSPKDIVQVEYIDVPGLEYGTGVGLVIKYITKPTERGITTSISIDKPLNRNNGEVDIISRFNYKNSEFSINYDAGYTKSRHFDARKTDETFNLPNGVLYRNGDEISQKRKETTNDIALLYMYNRPRKETFYIQAEYAFTNSPYNNSTSVLYNSGLRNDTTLKYNFLSQKDKTYSTEFGFIKYFGSAQYLYITGSYYKTHTDSYNNYKEVDNATTLTDIQTDITDKSYGIRSTVTYSIKFSDKIRLQTMLLDAYNNIKDIYTGTMSSNSHVIRNVAVFLTRLSITYGKFTSNVKFDIHRSSKRIGDESETEYSIEPTIDGRYLFNDRNYIGFRLNMFKNLPQLYHLTDATQVIDEFQVRRGNPSLKSGLIFDPVLNGNLGIGKFDISWNAKYSLYKDWINEETYLENNIIVRKFENFGTINIFKLNCEISPDLFDWLSLSLGFNYDISVNDDENYHRSYNNFHTSLDATATLGKWSFSTIFWSPNKYLYGKDFGQVEPGLYFSLLRTWFNGKLSTAITFYNPIKKDYFKESDISYSEIAPYKNYLYYNSLNKMLMFNISYKFDVGRKSSSSSIKTNVNVEKGIIKKE